LIADRASGDYRILAGIPFPPARDPQRADKQFSLLKANPQHPSVQFKKIGERHGNEIRSARVTLNYGALAIRRHNGNLWFWIGDHAAYDLLIS
jgi:hypothetical protein